MSDSSTKPCIANDSEVSDYDVDTYYALNGLDLWSEGCSAIADATGLDMDTVTGICSRNMGWAAEAVPGYAPSFAERLHKVYADIDSRARTPRGARSLFNRWLKEEDQRAKQELPRPTPAMIADMQRR